MAKSRVGLRKSAAAIRERLSGDNAIALPQALAAPFASFSKVLADYEAAAAKVDAAEDKREGALDAIGKTDDALDKGIDDYANGLVSAGLGSRGQPFKGYSKYAPSQLKELAFATEAAAVQELVKAVAATGPTDAVTAAGQALLARASAVTEALAALTKPQAEFEAALHARDLLLPQLRKAIRAFKTHAASVWFEDPATLKAVFAPPHRVQNPSRRRAPTPAAPATTPMASA